MQEEIQIISKNSSLDLDNKKVTPLASAMINDMEYIQMIK